VVGKVFGVFMLCKKKSIKGQVSIEFIVTILIVLLVFVYALMILQSRSEINLVSSQKWTAQDTAYRIARNINNAFLLDENVTLTDTIYWTGADKNVVLGDKSVKVLINDSYYDAPIYSGNYISWRVTDFNGVISFSKVNGTVVVSNS